MIRVRNELTARDLEKKARAVFEYSAPKIESLGRDWRPENGAPVYTVNGKYTSRGWTEWTQGFQFGSEILQFDATCETKYLEAGRKHTVELMASHVSHIGVHDHGFNNVSTYGNLLRLMNEGAIADNAGERNFYELALKASGAVQATRWSKTQTGGYIYSFNGPHSLFVDTIRSLRSLALSHRLGHVLMGENDRRIDLLERLVDHARTTAQYCVYYGEGRDHYDVRGRTAHESIFNVNDGHYRCPNSQQGYSAFSTWTRGLAWAMCGFAEQLEFLKGSGQDVTFMQKAAEATCDFYIATSPACGIPYWDTGAPNLHRLGDWASRAADPFNEFEPVDSSAAAIAAQGLLRLGRHLQNELYWQAGLTVCDSLFAEPYLSSDAEDQGLILHSVYHRPNGWDAPHHGACMWGDYHARELALYLLREVERKPYLSFWSERK